MNESKKLHVNEQRNKPISEQTNERKGNEQTGGGTNKEKLTCERTNENKQTGERTNTNIKLTGERMNEQTK